MSKYIKSKDYDKFSFISTNRDINLSHVKNIMESIVEHGLLEEITCNENYEIIDGQHRFKALQKLNLPITAKIKKGTTFKNIIPTNIVRRGWSISDYINFYSKLELEDYNLLVKVIEKNKSNKISISSLLEIYYKEIHYSVKYLRSGKYKIDVELGNHIVDVILNLGSYVPIYGSSAKFIRPMNKIIRRNPNLDILRFQMFILMNMILNQD